MLLQGTPGPAATTASLTPGVAQNLRQGNMGDAIVSELHGRFYEAAYRKTLYGGAMQAVIATALQTGLTTAATGGLVLSNPFGNTYNVVLQRVGFAPNIVAQTSAGSLGLGVGQSATALAGTLTSVTPRSKNIGSGATPTAGLYSSATITLPVAPTLDTVLCQLGTSAITATTAALTVVDMEGSIILPPGAFCCFVASAGLLASSYIFSFAWEEVPT